MNTSYKQHSPSVHSPVAATIHPWTCFTDRNVILLKASSFFIATPDAVPDLVVILTTGWLAMLSAPFLCPTPKGSLVLNASVFLIIMMAVQATPVSVRHHVRHLCLVIIQKQ